MLQVWQEAAVVGIVCVVLGSAVGAALGTVLRGPTGAWNRYLVMEVSLFFTGVLAHLLFETMGANRWYCKHGNACRAR